MLGLEGTHPYESYLKERWAWSWAVRELNRSLTPIITPHCGLCFAQAGTKTQAPAVPRRQTQATQQPPPGPRRTLTRHPGPACLSHPTSTCDFRRLQKPISINTKQTAARIAHLPNSLPLFCEPSHRNARCILGPRNTAQPRRRIAPLAHPVFRSFASLPLPSAHNLVDIFQVQDIPSRGVAQPWLRLLQRKVLPGRLWIS